MRMSLKSPPGSAGSTLIIDTEKSRRSSCIAPASQLGANGAFAGIENAVSGFTPAAQPKGRRATRQ